MRRQEAQTRTDQTRWCHIFSFLCRSAQDRAELVKLPEVVQDELRAMMEQAIEDMQQAACRHDVSSNLLEASYRNCFWCDSHIQAQKKMRQALRLRDEELEDPERAYKDDEESGDGENKRSRGRGRARGRGRGRGRGKSTKAADAKAAEKPPTAPPKPPDDLDKALLKAEVRVAEDLKETALNKSRGEEPEESTPKKKKKLAAEKPSASLTPRRKKKVTSQVCWI